MKKSESGLARNEGNWSCEPLRRELEHRPLVLAFLAFSAGLSSGFSPLNFLYAILLGPLVRGARNWSVFAAALLVGWVLKPELQSPIVVTGGVFQGQAHVITVPEDARGRIKLIVQTPERRYRLVLPNGTDVNLGDTLWLRAQIQPLPDGAVPQRLESASLRPEGPVRLVRKGWWPWRLATRLRASFLSFIESFGNPSTVGLVQALSFNVTGDLGDTTYDRLKRTGTIHVVSASGMHVTIISAILAWILLRLPLPRWSQLLLLVLGLTLYAAAAGLHPPMVRAVATVVVGSFAFAFSREPDALSALAAAGVGTLLLEPEAVGNIGFLLSYLSVAGLVMFSPHPRTTRSVASWSREWIRAGVLTSFVAWVATTPLIASELGQVSVVSLIANLLIVPVLTFSVAGSLAAWVLSIVTPVGVGLLKFVVEPLTGWVLAVVDTMGSLPWAAIATPRLPAWALVFAYVALASLYRPRRRSAEELTVW